MMEDDYGWRILARIWLHIVARRDEMTGYRFPVIIVRDDEGWSARCPDFQDCRARGASYEDAVENLRELVQVLIEDGLGDDETPAQPDDLFFTDMSLAV